MANEIKITQEDNVSKHIEVFINGVKLNCVIEIKIDGKLLLDDILETEW